MAHRLPSRLFSEHQRLGNTVLVTIGHSPAAPIIGDLMLRREDAWARLDVGEQARDRQAKLGWSSTPPTPPRRRHRRGA
jgi:hypothetical protein